MADEFDLRRLSALQEALGQTVPEIVATLVQELESALRAVGAGVDDGDLPAASLAAHAARNSALMIDAAPLLAELDEIEAGAGRGDLASAGAARAGLDASWPALRSALQSAAAKVQ